MLKTIAKTIHILHCDKAHANEWEQGLDKCYWYLEDQIESCWEQPDHKQYLVDAEILVRLMMEDPKKDITEEDIKKANTILLKIAEICSRISFLTSTTEGINGIVYKAINKALSS